VFQASRGAPSTRSEDEPEVTGFFFRIEKKISENFDRAQIYRATSIKKALEALALTTLATISPPNFPGTIVQ
jgi:hypothetical protein